ncbi:hypothetical protein FF38_14252 [Lucilia cuprina]|uniref:Uncharacterized protein n=1 Tax=Lucilia cuprina TaxID=7375 RepID=A0A0L0CNH8_LUCCU|nr:hypothetical protein FF38_14252 [Lucilia cuprina]
MNWRGWSQTKTSSQSSILKRLNFPINVPWRMSRGGPGILNFAPNIAFIKIDSNIRSKRDPNVPARWPHDTITIETIECSKQQNWPSCHQAQNQVQILSRGILENLQIWGLAEFFTLLTNFQALLVLGCKLPPNIFEFHQDLGEKDSDVLTVAEDIRDLKVFSMSSKSGDNNDNIINTGYKIKQPTSHNDWLVDRQKQESEILESRIPFLTAVAHPR